MSVIVLSTVPIQNKENACSHENAQTRDNQGILKSMSIPIFLLGIAFMFTVSATETFVGNFLAVYWNESYQIDSDVAGTILMICGVIHSLGSLIAGYLTDKCLSRVLTIFGGSTAIVAGTLLVDPMLFGFTWSNYVYSGIMFGFIELGTAMSQVSALSLMIFHDKELDVECSTEMMTRIFNTGYYFGSSAGPLIGSALLDLLSFSSAFLIFAVFAAAVFIFVGGAI